ncbi:sensor histidine kinase [Inconstantimicrobium mannanitabidum]|uniref:Two-component sensor histidine kinase n=1 Tax=Inconstantimicrobium mannanitabidum TaxID=1604901 RepID=A0ACB5RHZ9_9CLOT|nr:HAMP domain-containing sensor histidine kinase [Clostridium sp. TW13]GKX68720.1 two-component sensor histidine kinase [Clostridium sp. TW13]
MNKGSLVSKLLLTFTGIIGCSFIVVATILSVWLNGYFFEQKRNLFEREGKQLFNSSVKVLNNSTSNDELRGQFDIAVSAIDGDIALLDSSGYVCAANSTYPRTASRALYAFVDLKKADLLQRGVAVEEQNFRYTSKDTPQYAYEMPVVANGAFKGVLIISTPLENIKDPLFKVYVIIWLTAIIALIFANIVVYYFSQKILISPLEKINVAAKKLTKGDVQNRVDMNSDDEIGELAESFNIMADSLEKVEKNRREFISNVSHELRSPITSMKGFISGILDGVIPKDKENYYLNIVNDEIMRLTRLVNDLLDLSVMESGKFNLNKVELNINEVVKLCVINCEQKIKDKNLNVEVVLSEQHLYVWGDRDRIMQVVTNLLDNAIKYCLQKGNIKIHTKIRGDKAYISFYNDGPAISNEEIKHIWDRFYKSDKSRTNKISTGLGLPIVRNILTQHGEDIWVENKTPEKGVTFTFTLKRV